MDLKNYYNVEKIIENKGKIKKVFFYRICGTGMGAAACLLKEAGFEVEGADTLYYPPMSDYLLKLDIPCHKTQNIKEEYLKYFDLIVVGNVVPKNSEDAKLIEQTGIPFCSFPAAIGGLVLKDVRVIGIAGTHGKTTTTYLFSQVFKKLGETPGHFIGGVIEGVPSATLGEGRFFFIESDEYDSAYFEKYSKFHSYSIDDLVLTSLEFDHADIFDTIEDIKNEFLKLLKNLAGVYISNSSYEYINEVNEKLDNIKTLSFDDNVLSTMIVSEKGTSFNINWKEQDIPFKTNLFGKHNILNLTTVILYALNEGFSVEEIQSSVESLSLVKRRQEIRGSYKGSVVIDDFAHHPRAVELTIDSIKMKYPNKKVIAILEPNSATARSSIFQNEFGDSLKSADEIILAVPQRKTTAKNSSNIDMEKIAKSLNETSKRSFVVNDLNELRNKIDDLVSDDKVLLIMSNGTCLGLWESSFVESL